MENFYSKVNERKTKISMNKVADILLIVAIYLFAYRGNVGAVIALCSIVARLMSGKIVIKKNSMYIIMWALFILFFSVVLYVARTLNLEFYVLVAYISSLYILLIFKEIDYKLLFKGLFFVSEFVLIGVFLQYFLPGLYDIVAKLFFPTDIYLQNLQRASSGYVIGFTREVAYSALFLVLGISYLLFLTEKKYKYIYILIYFFALFLTGKKAQPIFLLIALFFLYIFQTKKLTKHLKIYMLAIIGVLVIYVSFPIWKNFAFLSRIVQFIEGFIAGGDLLELTSGRLVIYERALELWESDKIFGIGWTNFRQLGAYGNSEYTTWFQYFDVHNCYLQLLCETGIIGLSLYLILLIASIIAMIKILRVYKSPVIKYSMTYIFLFVLYSITEPCLYTDSYFIIFFICISCIFAYKDNLGEL